MTESESKNPVLHNQYIRDDVPQSKYMKEILCFNSHKSLFLAKSHIKKNQILSAMNGRWNVLSRDLIHLICFSKEVP